MKQMTEYRPHSTEDTLSISASSEDTEFKANNLKSIIPDKSWKSSVVTESWVKYDFGSTVDYTDVFINRINFASFYIEISQDDSTWVTVDFVEKLTKDEIEDENYVHTHVSISSQFRYLRIRIPTQTPLFEPTYFKIGNLLVGNLVKIWNPKSGFKVDEVPSLSKIEFPTSGHLSVTKIGKTRRVFSGTLDKFKKTEYDKIIKTYKPFVLLLEFDNDPTSIYLVRNPEGYSREHYLSKVVNMSFRFYELV